MQHRPNATQAAGNAVLELVGGLPQTTVHLWPLIMAAGITRFWVKRVQAYAEQVDALAMRRGKAALTPGGVKHALLTKSEDSETHPEVIKAVRRTTPKALAVPAARPKRATAKPKKATAKHKPVDARRKSATATRKTVGAKPTKKARRG